MVNVTKTIPRKFKSRRVDILVSGKKCKDYDPFRTTLDAGNVYKNGGFVLLFRLPLNIFVRINSTICLIVKRSCAPNFNFISYGALKAFHCIWDSEPFLEMGIMNNRKFYKARNGQFIFFSRSDANPGQWMVFQYLNLIRTQSDNDILNQYNNDLVLSCLK